MPKTVGAAAPFAFLSLLVGAVYGRAAGFPFIRYDDYPHVVDNPVVREGLTLEGVRWAFTTDMDAGWIPLTWLSRMADVSLFGMDAGGHHLVNVLFHLANVLLLFHVLRRMTGRPWESGFVAALFAVHPLHVESVAWVTERKDVLAGFFWMLSLWAYARYSERPGLSRYLAVALCFALGLMSKPIVVTLPFVLLLLDFWPLGRLRLPGDAVPEGAAIRPAPWRRLVLEKAPLLAMSAAASAVTVISEQGDQVILSLADVSPGSRIANALQSYVLYLAKLAWPAKLAVFYPHPGDTIPFIAAAGFLAFLAAVTCAVIASTRGRRWLATGWFWYLGTLVPMIGIVQAGDFAMADRCAYLPAIGIYMVAAWGLPGLLSRVRVPPAAARAALLACILALSFRAFWQVGLWRDTGTLFRHALSATGDNWIAHLNLGESESAAGRDESALVHFREALRINPRYTDAKYATYSVLDRLGRKAEAIRHFESALRDSRSTSEGITRVGLTFAASGKIEEAAACFGEALRRDPGYAEGHYNLAVALVRLGRKDEAHPHFLAALRIRPTDGESINRIGVALMGLGRYREAAERFREALEMTPGLGEARFNLGVALRRDGRTDEARACFLAILRDSPGDPDAAGQLAAMSASVPR